MISNFCGITLHLFTLFVFSFKIFETYFTFLKYRQKVKFFYSLSCFQLLFDSDEEFGYDLNGKWSNECRTPPVEIRKSCRCLVTLIISSALSLDELGLKMMWLLFLEGASGANIRCQAVSQGTGSARRPVAPTTPSLCANKIFFYKCGGFCLHRERNVDDKRPIQPKLTRTRDATCRSSHPRSRFGSNGLVGCALQKTRESKLLNFTNSI